MSSTYRAFCLNHDPALVIDGEWSKPDAALAAVESRTETLGAHERCDLIIGRYSSPLIELICPINLDRDRSTCFHSAAQRIDLDWVRLALAAAAGDYNAAVGAALDRIDRTCWRVDRMRKLADLIESGGYS